MTPQMTSMWPFVQPEPAQEALKPICYIVSMTQDQSFTPRDPNEMPTIQALDQEIGVLAATINAATYRLISLIGDMDRLGG